MKNLNNTILTQITYSIIIIITCTYSIIIILHMLFVPLIAVDSR